jgi:hypothetical protein
MNMITSRTIALGLLASGIPISAGSHVLHEPWELDHVPPWTVLSTLDGYTLGGTGMIPPDCRKDDDEPGIPKQ